MYTIRILLIAFYIFFMHAALFCTNDNNQNQDTRLIEFEKYAQKAMVDCNVPGMAVAIVDKGAVVYIKGFGVKTIGTDDSVDSDTLFQIGSISKSFTGALMGIVTERYNLSWQAKVTDYYTPFKLQDPCATNEFMIQDLFAQNSGLNTQAADCQGIVGYSTNHIIETLRFIKPVSSFRSKFAYQNIPFIVAEKIMENITHKNFPMLASEHLLRPLEMNSSSFTYSDFYSAINAAALHRKENGVIVAMDKNYEGSHCVYTFGPAGGINSTVRDMANYLLMMVNEGTFNDKKILASETVAYITTPKTIIDSNRFYCQGWMVCKQGDLAPTNITWHNGGTLGHRNILAYSSKEKCGIVILSNLFGSNFVDNLAFQFFYTYLGNNQDKDLIAQEIAQVKQQDEADQKAKEEELQKIENGTKDLDGNHMPFSIYEGIYHNKVYDSVEVIKENENLVLVIGPDKIRMKLEHIFRDTFRLVWFSPFDDLSITNDKIYFTINPFGKAVKMYCEYFKYDDNGIFERVTD